MVKSGKNHGAETDNEKTVHKSFKKHWPFDLKTMHVCHWEHLHRLSVLTTACDPAGSSSQRCFTLSRLEMGKNAQFGVQVRFEFFVDVIGSMFPRGGHLLQINCINCKCQLTD